VTVTYRGEIHDQRKASNKQGKRSYTRVFLLTTDSRSDGAFTVGSNVSLPVIGSAFPDDANAVCKSIDVACVDGFTKWHVTCNYDDTYQVESTPTNDETRISWSSEIFQREAWKDKDGDGVLNSAGDPFNPPVMRDDARTVCRIVQNASSVPTYVLTYPNCVNSTSFTIDGVSVAARYAKISNVGVSEERRRNGTVYREVTIEMHIRNETWDFEILDAGFREFDPADSTKRILITNDDGTDITEPACLDGSGAKVATPTPANAVFGTFRVYTELNYVGTIPGCT
jgi:hypothetical protein